MKSLLPTILIISAGILAGCSSPSATIVAAGRKPSPPPPLGSKVHVVIQSPRQPVNSLKSNPSAPNYWPEGRGIQTANGQQTLSDTVAAQLADKGYVIVPSIEADYWVTAHLTRHKYTSTFKPNTGPEDKDIVRTHYAGPVEVSTPEGVKSVPVKISYVTNESMDKPDMRIDPDDDFILNVEIMKVSPNRSKEPEIVWTGKLVTKNEADPQRYVRTLLNYLGQDFDNRTLLAQK